MPAGTVIIRADASVAMGTGHVMRCLALAQAWQDEGGRCVFAMAETTPAVEDRVRAEKVDLSFLSTPPASLQDAAAVVELATNAHASWVVVDGYRFDVEYQRALKAAGLKLLLVDDTGHAGTYLADLVVDQNSSASESFYQHKEPYTRLLLGSRYAMLRREFNPWREWKREISSQGTKVLITMGGSDPQNVTLRAIEALRSTKVDGIEAVVVAGGSNPHIGPLEDATGNCENIRLHKNAANMAELIAWADVAVSAAGTICWEMCFLGLPAILIDLAENQRPIAQDLDRRGIAIHLGRGEDTSAQQIANQLEWLLRSPDVRNTMSDRGRQLVDGRGAGRVVSAMLGAGLRLRPVEEKDCRLLWEWANDPDVRSAAFNSAPIPWEQHLDWFKNKLSNKKLLMLIATDEQGSPIGQIRFERSGDGEADIDVSIARASRGRGMASLLIEKAVETVFQDRSMERVHAFVKPGNHASAKAFERAGFRNAGDVWVKGHAALHYQRDRDGKK